MLFVALSFPFTHSCSYCILILLFLLLLWSILQEYGHYSTEEELRGQEEGTCECPVCFDNPHTPVTLDCHHTFCEVCILEWLEKEQTCPVCRAKVEGCSALVEAVKAESAYTFPLFA